MELIFRVLSLEMFQSLWTGVAEYYIMIILSRPKLKDENKTRKKMVSKMTQQKKQNSHLI